MEPDVLNVLEKNFYFGLTDREDALFSMSAAELLKPGEMKQFLRMYASCIKARELKPAAAYFCGWFGYVGMAQLYMLAVKNKQIDLSLANMTIQLYARDGHFLFAFKPDRWSERPLPESGKERSEQRLQALEQFYAHTVRPLFTAVSAAAEIGIGQLWGQLPARYSYCKDMLLALAGSADLQARIDGDFAALVHQLAPEVFGRKQNPFRVRIRLLEDLHDPARKIPIKSACCLYFMTEGGDYCYNCPKLKDEERKKRWNRS
jgi:ferric iron reductase protein FhuF